MFLLWNINTDTKIPVFSPATQRETKNSATSSYKERALTDNSGMYTEKRMKKKKEMRKSELYKIGGNMQLKFGGFVKYMKVCGKSLDGLRGCGF